jgi:prolipoprotein diacylglyceryltransferase
VRPSKLDLDTDDIIDINLYMTIFGVIGSRILHVFVDGHLQDYVNLCIDPLKVPGHRRLGLALQRRQGVWLRLPVRHRATCLLPTP